MSFVIEAPDGFSGISYPTISDPTGIVYFFYCYMSDNPYQYILKLVPGYFLILYPRAFSLALQFTLSLRSNKKFRDDKVNCEARESALRYKEGKTINNNVRENDK